MQKFAMLVVLFAFSSLVLGCTEMKDTSTELEKTVPDVTEEGATEAEGAADSVTGAVEDGADEVKDAADDAIEGAKDATKDALEGAAEKPRTPWKTPPKKPRMPPKTSSIRSMKKLTKSNRSQRRTKWIQAQKAASSGGLLSYGVWGKSGSAVPWR